MRTDLESSVISSFNYDEATLTLDITFRSGRVYTFERVPVEVVRGLVGSDSPGRYFNQNIKGVYG